MPDNIITCPHCHQQHANHAEFCPETGKEILENYPLCSNCGQPIQNSEEVCPNCGSEVLDQTTQNRGRKLHSIVIINLIVVGLCVLGSLFFVTYNLLKGREILDARILNDTFNAVAVIGLRPGTIDNQSEAGSSEDLSVPAINKSTVISLSTQIAMNLSNGTTTPDALVGTHTQTPISPYPYTPTGSPAPTITPTSTATPMPTLPKAFQWNKEVVQESQSMGYYSNLIIDSLDVMRAIYFEDDNDQVWYSTYESGQWKHEFVVGGPETGHYLSLALDSENNPHIAYHQYGKKQTPEVRYARKTGSQWETIRVIDSYSAKSYVSLAMDPEGNPHIIYLDGNTFNVRHAYYTEESGWSDSVVDVGSQNCLDMGIHIDDSNVLRMTYQNSDGYLILAELFEGEWKGWVIDNRTGSGEYSDIVVDAEGHPHIVYNNIETGILHYAALNEDTWVIEDVDSNGNVGTSPSIEVSKDLEIHVSYYDNTNANLKYAHGRNHQWDVYTVDDQGRVGKWNSLALDSHGIPYITYVNEDREDLMLAWASR